MSFSELRIISNSLQFSSANRPAIAVQSPDQQNKANMQKQIYFTKNASKISTDDEQTHTCMLNIKRDTNFHVSDAFLSFAKKHLQI